MNPTPAPDRSETDLPAAGTPAIRGARTARGRWSAYALAVVVTIATVAIRLELSDWFGDRPVLVLFILPIFLSAFLGGLGPGLVATGLVALATSYALIPPIRSFAMERSVDAVQWLILLVIGGLISVLTESRHRARRGGDNPGDGQPHRSTERRVQAGFGFALAFLGVIGAMALLGVNRLGEDAKWTRHSERVISSLRLLLSTVTDAETAQRGYALTGDASYLEPDAAARATIDGELKALRALTADNAAQQAKLEVIAPLVGERMKVAQQEIELRRTTGAGRTAAAGDRDRGKQLHDRLRKLIGEMEAIETGLLHRREAEAKRAGILTQTVISVGGALAFGFVTVALFVMNQEFAVRRRAEAALREARDTLEARVRERTAALERTNDSLRESEELFSNAFRLSPDCVAIVRVSDRQVIKANEALCRLWGGTPEQIIGHPTQEYSTWPDEQERAAFLRILEEKGECLNHETRLRLSDGRLVPFLLSARAITVNGEPGVLSIMRDITERRRAEAAAVTIAAIVESSDDAIIGKDLESRVTSWNPGAEKIFGYAAAEMVGHSIRRIIPADRQAEERRFMEQIGRGEPVRHFETVRIRKDGRPVDISVTVSPIKDASGAVVGASKIARDISERKQAEAALRVGRELLANVIDSTPSYIFATDRDHRYVLVNAAYARFLGRPAGEIVGRTLRELHPGAAADALVAAHEAIMAAGAPQQIDETLLGAALMTTKFPLRDLQGAITGLCGVATDITARRQTAEALAASEARYRTLFQHAPDGILIADPASNYLDGNASICRMLGYGRAELIGLNATDIVVATEVANIEPALQAIKAGTAYHREWQFRRKEGALLEAEVIATMMPDGNLMAVVRDITERKVAERALRASEERVRLAAEATGVGIWEWDLGTDTVRWDAQMFRIYGLTPTPDGTVPYATWRAAVLPEDLPQQEAQLQETLRGVRRGAREFRIRQGGTGECRQIQAVEAVRLGGEGRREWIVGTNLDITERKRIEAAVKESEQQFRTMANSIPQLAWIAHADGSIFWYNRRWYEYTGTTPEEMDGWGWQRVHDPAELPRVMAAWKACIEAGRPLDLKFPLRAADGRFRTFLTRVEPVRDSAGQVVRWFGTNTDVEVLREAEEKVGRLNAELEQRVAQRTAQLEVANQELEAFSYSVSHDLRAPLRAVDGFSRIVIEDFGPQLPAEARRCLENVARGAQQMGLLIDDLLSFSRLSRLPLSRREVKVDKLVRDTLADLAGQREGRAVEIRIGELPPCLGDPALLKQVWINLLSNALKYTQRREAALVEIGCERKDGAVIYFVRDNGAGFDMQYADKLFRVFQRLHRAEDYAGTGVGLAIVQRVVHRHGGRIWADAAVERGATFRFTLGSETLS